MGYLELAINLIDIIIWPLVAIVIICMFRKEFKEILKSFINFKKMSFKIAGHEFSAENIEEAVVNTKKELARDELYQLLVDFADPKSNNKRINKNPIMDEVSERIISMTNFNVGFEDVKALILIKENPGMSTDKIFNISKKYGEFINGGHLTGLEHDALIKGHLGSKFRKINKIYLTEKGEKILSEINKVIDKIKKNNKLIDEIKN